MEGEEIIEEGVAWWEVVMHGGPVPVFGVLFVLLAFLLGAWRVKVSTSPVSWVVLPLLIGGVTATVQLYLYCRILIATRGDGTHFLMIVQEFALISAIASIASLLLWGWAAVSWGRRVPNARSSGEPLDAGQA